MIKFLPLLITVIGVLMFGLSGNSKISEIGRIMFGVGLFVFLLKFVSV